MMDGISAWVLGIVGVVVLGVLIDVIIPEGQTNKYIKSVFAIVTVFVIVAPLPGLLNADWSPEEIFAEQPAGKIDEEYLGYLTDRKIAALEGELEKAVGALGYAGAKIKVDGKDFEGRILVNKIFVDLSKVGIDGEDEHIDITREIVSKICELSNVEKGQVTVYGI